MNRPAIKLTIAVAPSAQAEVLKNVYWIDQGLEEVAFDPGDAQIVYYRYADGREAPERVKAELKNVIERIAQSVEMLPTRVIYRSPAFDNPGCTDPYAKLVDQGYVRRVGDGIHVYADLMVKLFVGLDRVFRDEAVHMQTQECIFPSLITFETLKKTGYLEGFPHNANFVCHVPEQAEAIVQLKQKLSGTALQSCPVGDLQDADFALSPTVCYHYYRSIRDTVVPDGYLGVTATSPCYRYESKATRGLRRLREFNMREIIFVGRPENILEQRDALVAMQQKLLERFRLNSTIETASDPFFLDSYDKKRMFQLGFDLKHEVCAELPGDRDSLAIGSVNYHQDHFGKAFNISLPSREPAHSCCLGFGIDRWCYAVFAQHGCDPLVWPDELKTLVV